MRSTGGIGRAGHALPSVIRLSDPSKPVDAQAIVILGGGEVRIAPEYGGWATEGEVLERVSYGAIPGAPDRASRIGDGHPGGDASMSGTLGRDLESECGGPRISRAILSRTRGFRRAFCELMGFTASSS